MQRHSNFTISADIQSNSVSLLVLLCQTMTELCTSMPAAPVLRTFSCAVAYLTTFCSRPEAASDVLPTTFLRLTVSDKCVKFRDPCLTFSRNSTGSRRRRYFRSFKKNFDKCQREVACPPCPILHGTSRSRSSRLRIADDISRGTTSSRGLCRSIPTTPGRNGK